MCTEYESAVRNEIAYWPGVDVHFSMRSKHGQATFHYGGETRFVIIPLTPSDSRRGAMNCITDVRRELNVLGAARLERKPKARKRTNRVIGRRMPNRPTWADRIEPAPLRANPLDILALVTFAKPSRWQRFMAWTGSIIRRAS